MPVVGVDELSMLDPGHQGQVGQARRADRSEGVEGGPDGQVADGVDHRRDARLSGPPGLRRQPLTRFQRAAVWPGRSRALVGVVVRLEHRGRPRADAAVGEELQPADTEAVRDAALRGRGVPAWRHALVTPPAGADGGLELLVADAGMDPQRQVAVGRHGTDDRWATFEGGARDEGARVVYTGHADGREMPRVSCDRRSQRLRVRLRDGRGTDARGVLVEQAIRSP